MSTVLNVFVSYKHEVTSQLFSSPLGFSDEYLILAFKLYSCAFKDGEVAAEVLEVTLDEVNLTQVMCLEGESFE